MKNTSSQPAAWYALRRTLPIWSFEQNLQELVEKLPEYKVDELIIKVDTEEFSHGQIPLDWLRAYQPKLFKVKEAMEKIDVVYSLNPWMTQGHIDRGRNARKQLPGIITYVGHDGQESTCCACALSEVWRKNIAAAWTIYAETKPNVLWVEDDIRTFNHGPVRYGCFCELHMRKFSHLAGEKVSRKQLVAAILQPGKPHPWRKLYMEMQAQTMIDTAEFLAGVIHNVSPETSLGLMSSGPSGHCSEGRRWKEFASALSDGIRLYSRPPMGSYTEGNLRDLTYCANSIKITRHCLPENTIEHTEVENIPFSQFSKSSAFTLLQMIISFCYGSRGVTMNLFDHLGSPMELNPVYGKMLAEKKTFLNSLAQIASTPGTSRGVRLLHRDNSSWFKELSTESDYSDLQEDGINGAMLLEMLGIATDYNNSNVTAALGQTLRAYSDEEIIAMLKQGMFVDGVAAQVLFERGFGSLLGLDSIKPAVRIDLLGEFSAEENFNPEFGGTEKRFITMIAGPIGLPSLAVLTPVSDSIPISALADPDARRGHPVMYAYENELGGRVVVAAFDIATVGDVRFCSPYRRIQMQAVFDWLSFERPDLLVKNDGASTMCMRKDFDTTTLLGIFNLSLDPWQESECNLQANSLPKQIKRLLQDGKFEDVPVSTCSMENSECMRITIQQEVSFMEPLLLLITW